MKTVYYDSNGDHIALKREGGCLWPLTMDSMFSVRDLSTRPDDVFLCGYPRSGTNWLSDLIMMLLQNDFKIQEVSKMDSMLEYVGCEHIDKLKSPRVINTHLNYRLLPRDLFEKRCKIVLVCRDPKDVAVSYYHFVRSRRHYEYSGKFEGFLGLFQDGIVPYGSWFDYTLEWDKAIKADKAYPVHVVYYEQMKTDFKSTIKALASFLEVSKHEDFYEEMERSTDFSTFKKSKADTLSEKEKSRWRGQPEFIRKGITGDWKNWFLVDQYEQFQQLLLRRMQGCSLQSGGF